MAHAVGLDQVGHVRLIQHSDPGYLRVVSYAHAAHAVVPGRRYLAGASRSVAFFEKTKLSIRMKFLHHCGFPIVGNLNARLSAA